MESQRWFVSTFRSLFFSFLVERDHVVCIEKHATCGSTQASNPSDADSANHLVNDFLRGKLPWYTPPPVVEGKDGENPEGIDGRKGALGEMGKIRKREEEEPGVEDLETNSANDATNDDPARPLKRRKKG